MSVHGAKHRLCLSGQRGKSKWLLRTWGKDLKENKKGKQTERGMNLLKVKMNQSWENTFLIGSKGKRCSEIKLGVGRGNERWRNGCSDRVPQAKVPNSISGNTTCSL